MRTELKHAESELKELIRRRDGWISEMGKNQQAIQNRLDEIENARQAYQSTRAKLEGEIKAILEEHGKDFTQYQINLQRIEQQKNQIDDLRKIGE